MGHSETKQQPCFCILHGAASDDKPGEEVEECGWVSLRLAPAASPAAVRGQRAIAEQRLAPRADELRGGRQGMQCEA